MARVAIGHECWEGLGHILAGWKWSVQIWGGGSVTGSSLDSTGCGTVGAQMLVVRVLTEVDTKRGYQCGMMSLL